MSEGQRSRLGLTPRLNPNANARASSEMVEQITQAFYNGLHPGDWIGTETDLAEAFGVSRITARDATRVLEARGIVEVKVGARGGLRVAQPDPDRVIAALGVQLHLLGVTDDEILQARLAMEPVAAGLAAHQATDEEIETLRILIKDGHGFASKASLFPEFITSNTHFHSRLAMASHNRALSAAIVSLHNDVVTLWMARGKRERMNRVIRAHEDILDAIAARDSAAAQALMTDHLKDLMEGLADEGPQTPSSVRAAREGSDADGAGS